MKLFGAFEKVEPQDDGTLMVSGYASSEAVDSDGEVVKASAIADAIPDYMRFGAVREMHQPKAAGTALEMQVQDDGRTFFVAHVVDSEAVKKVTTGTYKGFSIGGKVTARDSVSKNTITGLRLTEVSLVDRPANPEAVFLLAKMDDAGTEAPAVTPEPVAETPAEPVPEPVAKGLDAVACLAGVLQQLQWIAADSAWEADYEGDQSPVPARLRAWLADGAGILAAMSAEEAAEAVAAVPAPEPADDTMALAAAPADVQKVEQPETPAPDAEDAIAKRVTDLVAAALEKVAGTLAEKDTTIADLAKRLQALEDQPAPPKGAVRAVSKAEDNALPGTAVPAPDALAKALDAAQPIDLVRASHQRPVFVLGAPPTR